MTTNRGQGKSRPKFTAAAVIVLLFAIIAVLSPRSPVRHAGSTSLLPACPPLKKNTQVRHHYLVPTGRQSAIKAGLPISTRKTMLVTAYCHCRVCCGKSAAKVTANGHKIRHPSERFVAADRNIPFGTKVIIPGYAKNKPVRVLDRGRKIKGDRIDVYLPTHAQAKEWGVRLLPVNFEG